MKNIMPAVFVGHGTPMNAAQDNGFTKTLSAFAGSIPKPKAVLCVSAHWVSDGTFVTGSENPEQIYDFYGFPQELYEIKYRPKGSVSLAKRTAELLGGLDAGLNSEWGTDHGAWSVLKHMYPECDIPVVQLSLNAAMSEEEHFKAAKHLSALRKEGVLILGSGNIVHNLSMIDWDQFAKKITPWALEFDSYVKRALDSGNDAQLINFAENDRNAGYAVPTNEHYLPMLYIAALRGKGEKLNYFYEGFQHSSLSMRCFAVGA
jgi:4,5-DOPA dioxygenase extradiol